MANQLVREALPGTWEDAIQLWLSRQNSPNTRRSYETSLRLLMRYSGKQPWDISRMDINQWLVTLQKTCADTTLAARLTAISSFYGFILQDYIIKDAQGNDRTLRKDNPALGVKRPKINPYGKATCLDIDGAKALLKSINRNQIIGKRDYALFLGYLMLGLRNSEWRSVRHEDIELRPAGMVIRYNGKGKHNQTKELFEPVFIAIREYCIPEGRESGFIFHSYGPRGEILEQPVSANYTRRALKYYADKAGLNAEVLRVHSLRHTAALLRREAGDDVEKIQEFLGHSSISITQIYLHTLKTAPDKTWQTVAQYLGV
ncbi:MAG: tyrosine-type recombinase/integrase [Anaerolineaceae bacterium]